MAGALRAIFRPAVDFALPPRCPACGTIVEDDHRFCVDCWRALDHLEAGCIQCGDPGIEARDHGQLCGACLADPPAFETMRAAVGYGDISRRIALKLKYGGRPGLAATIARALDRHMAGLGEAIVVPVPLHRWRIWRRGYNQSALIARALVGPDAGRLGLETIERRRATPYLRGMSRAERARIVRGAFRVPEAGKATIAGRTIVLIDDVYTTGATARACAKALRRAGASAVHVRCWARVTRDEHLDS